MRKKRRPPLAEMDRAFQILVGSLVALALAVASAAAAEPLDLLYTLEPVPVPASSAVTIRFTLVNNGGNDLWVIPWNTPLEGLMGAILTVACDGQYLPYHGIEVKRRPPGAADYVLIKAHSRVSAEIDLSRAYAFPKTGRCAVDFRGYLLDIRAAQPAAEPDVQRLQQIPGRGTTVTLGG